MIRALYHFLVSNLYLRIYRRACQALAIPYFFLNGIRHGRVVCVGMPSLDIHPLGECTIGTNVSMVSNSKFATLGKNNRCKLMVSSGGKLKIGSKVGMSNTTIVATLSVEIGDNVMLGGGVTIVDSDFHSMNPVHWHTPDDLMNMKRAPVVIHDNVFIGMNSIILKGVDIGVDVVIAAGSVVITDIPAHQIWGGNPARFIRHKQSFN